MKLMACAIDTLFIDDILALLSNFFEKRLNLTEAGGADPRFSSTILRLYRLGQA
jgi:hypothetical protein